MKFGIPIKFGTKIKEFEQEFTFVMVPSNFTKKTQKLLTKCSDVFSLKRCKGLQTL